MGKLIISLLFIQFGIDDLKCIIRWMADYRSISRTRMALVAVDNEFENNVVGTSDENTRAKGTFCKIGMLLKCPETGEIDIRRSKQNRLDQ